MMEAFPLADQPHLLQSGARREELFGAPRQRITIQPSVTHPPGTVNPLKVIPTRLGFSTRTSDIHTGYIIYMHTPLPSTSAKPTKQLEIVLEIPQNLSLKDSDAEVIEISRYSSVIDSGIVSPHRVTSAAVQSVIVRTGNVVADTVVQRSSSSTTNSADAQPSASCSWLGKSSPLPTVGQLISSDLLLGRWRLTLYLFGRVFIDDFDLESGSFIALLGGFPTKEDRFRQNIERLRNMQQRDSTFFKMNREREQLIIKTFKELNAQYNNHCRRATASKPALAVSKVKVTFKDEPGEISGVAHSFYTAIAESFFTREMMPNLDVAQLGVGSKTSQSSMVCIRQLLIYFIFSLL